MKTTTRTIVILIGVLWLGLLAVVPVAAQWAQTAQARIAIVWPTSGAGVGASPINSQRVNISVWPVGSVGCSADPALQLLVAKNNGITGPAGGTRQFLLGRGFPSIEFNDIPADLAAEPSAQYRFVMYGPSSPTANGFSGNVWVHAVDPRTFYPVPLAPTGITTRTVDLDARIQVVYPHDQFGALKTVEAATLVNVAVEVYAHGTTLQVGSITSGAFPYTPTLQIAEANGPLHTLAVTPVLRNIPTTAYMRWEFNDIPVVPGHQYHFVAGAIPLGSASVSRYGTVWTHGMDGRTNAPYPVAPPSCTPSYP